MAEDRRDLWKTTSIGLVIAAIVAVYDNKKHDEAYRSGMPVHEGEGLHGLGRGGPTRNGPRPAAASTGRWPRPVRPSSTARARTLPGAPA